MIYKIIKGGILCHGSTSDTLIIFPLCAQFLILLFITVLLFYHLLFTEACLAHALLSMMQLICTLPIYGNEITVICTFCNHNRNILISFSLLAHAFCVYLLCYFICCSSSINESQLEVGIYRKINSSLESKFGFILPSALRSHDLQFLYPNELTIFPY